MQYCILKYSPYKYAYGFVLLWDIPTEFTGFTPLGFGQSHDATVTVTSHWCNNWVDIDGTKPQQSRKGTRFVNIDWLKHYTDVIMGATAFQITSPTIVYSTVYSGADQRKHQSSASLAFVRGIHRGPVNSPHKWPVTRKMFPLDGVIRRHDMDREMQDWLYVCAQPMIDGDTL